MCSANETVIMYEFHESDWFGYYNWSSDYLDELDTSEFPFPNTLWKKKPSSEIIWKTCFMLFIGFSGIWLNTVILVIIATNKWLWTTSNYLIANMAFADLLTLFVSPWLFLIRDFYQDYKLGYLGCKIEGFIQGALLLSSVSAIILVSYDRLASTTLSADAKITKTAVPKLIVCSWGFAAALSIPWILKRQYIERQWLDHLECFCVEDVNVLQIYWHVIASILVWIPLTLMIITYGSIIWRLERSVRQLQSRGGGQSIVRARGRAMRTIGAVLLVAAVCRIPYTALVYWRNNLPNEINSADGWYSVLWFTANTLVFVNCAVNPLIYGFTNEKFRKAMDRTAGIACFKFGAWCWTCKVFNKKVILNPEKNTEKIFVIESTPTQKRMNFYFKNILRSNKDTLDFSTPKAEEITSKPTKITSIKAIENV